MHCYVPALAAARAGSPTKAQSCVPLISTMHGQPFLIPLVMWRCVDDGWTEIISTLPSENTMVAKCLHSNIIQIFTWWKDIANDEWWFLATGWSFQQDAGRRIMTSSNGNFPALLALCTRNSPVTGEFHSQRPVTRSFDVFCDLRLNKRLSKHL